MGRLHRVHAGVYAVGHPLVTREGRWLAAVLASPLHAVLSHRSAAALWRIRPSSRSRVDVCVARKSRSTVAIARHHATVPDDERAEERGIPATSIHRTILDLAAVEPVEVVASMIREAEYRRLGDRLSLPQLLERYPRRRGTQRLRVALERVERLPPGTPVKPLEERFVPFLGRHGLPRPRLNDWILLEARRFRVDCHWPADRLIVELDGWEGHRSRSAFRSDRARDRALHVAGFEVVRLTWAQLDDEPDQIAADLRDLLRIDGR